MAYSGHPEAHLEEDGGHCELRWCCGWSPRMGLASTEIVFTPLTGDQVQLIARLWGRAGSR